MISSSQRRIIKPLLLTLMIMIGAAGAFSLLTIRDDQGRIPFVHLQKHAGRTSKYFNSLPDTISPYVALGKEVRIDAKVVGRLSKTIFGFYPYWMNEYHRNLPYELLTHVAYFNYTVNPETGGPLDVHRWMTTSLVDEAHQHGVKVVLVAACFGLDQNRLLLSNVTARKTLIDSLVYHVKARNADGINIDFEAVPDALGDTLTAFMNELGDSLRSNITGAHLSIDLPSINSDKTFDVAALSEICDNLMIMCYDYYYGSSDIAGPVAPLRYDGTWRKEHVASTIASYLGKGAAPEKLLLGIPFYGYEWNTESSAPGSKVIRHGTPRYYSSIREENLFDEKRFDEHSQTAWLPYHSGGAWKQIWFDDSSSLTRKYHFTDSCGLGGVGIWALGYDGGHAEIWNGIVDAFVKVEKIDFERSFPLIAITEAHGARGISALSRLERIPTGEDNHSLRVVAIDSMRHPKEWFIPLHMHNLLVLPGQGFITMKIRARNVPRRAIIFCEVDTGKGRMKTLLQPLLQNNSWIEYTFPLPRRMDSSPTDASRIMYASLSRICIEAPGNSRMMQIEFDEISAVSYLLPKKSKTISSGQKNNRFEMFYHLEGKEIKTWMLQRYNDSKQRWEIRSRGVVRANDICDGSASDSLERVGIFHYRFLAYDAKQNAIELGNREIDNTPGIAITSSPIQLDSMTITFTIPTADSYAMEYLDEMGDTITTEPLKSFEAGIHAITRTLKTSNNASLPAGIYFLRLSGEQYTSTTKFFVMK